MAANMIKVNNVYIANPSKMDFSYEDLDAESSGRNQRGKMFRDVLGTKVKIELEWPAMSVADANSLLASFKDPFFTVEYFDPKENAITTKSFYAGSKALGTYTCISGTYKYSGLSLSIIER